MRALEASTPIPEHPVRIALSVGGAVEQVQITISIEVDPVESARAAGRVGKTEGPRHSNEAAIVLLSDQLIGADAFAAFGPLRAEKIRSSIFGGVAPDAGMSIEVRDPQRALPGGFRITLRSVFEVERCQEVPIDQNVRITVKIVIDPGGPPRSTGVEHDAFGRGDVDEGVDRRS
jgi:hypothetical protein